ncbi:MAG: type II secretion system F family protein [Candidatus Omnitrophica bacterium]|nr:type II secretion system F family protein [Candidatus Omnitrophota bacterium]
MFLLTIILPASATFLVYLSLVSLIQEKAKAVPAEGSRQDKSIVTKMRALLAHRGLQQTTNLYFVLPPLFAILGAVVFKSFIFFLLGAGLGLFVPNLMVQLQERNRKAKFNSQILDSIMILSSSLKGGLSLLQSLEVLVEEMPAPMSQEMGLVVRENKMGVTLEESLKHLMERMKMEELGLVVNSILVARETGGDLTKVLSRLSTTIRDNRKLKDSIKTLTMQGRMQGIIMSFLPFLFIWWVLSFNKGHFDIMLKSELGRMLLFIAAVLQVVGMVLIKKFSAINV